MVPTFPVTSIPPPPEASIFPPTVNEPRFPPTRSLPLLSRHMLPEIVRPPPPLPVTGVVVAEVVVLLDVVETLVAALPRLRPIES